MSEQPTPETDALECAFALLKCSPIGYPKNSYEYVRAAYIMSEHCQGKEDVSEAAMRIFAKRIAELEHERDEIRNENIGWENKWKFAIEMAARAEVERDEAIRLLKLCVDYTLTEYQEEAEKFLKKIQ